jgi:hypothetical protein
VNRTHAYIAAGAALVALTIVLVVTSRGDSQSKRDADISGPVGIRSPRARPAPVLAQPRVGVADGWREALGRPGELGSLFLGFRFGERMPPVVEARIDAWQRRYHGVIRYSPNLDSGYPTLDILFEDRAAARAALVALWDRPDLDWGAYSNPTEHMLAALYDDGTKAGLVFTPHATIGELVRPSDPGPLGFEPIPLIGLPTEKAEETLALGIERSGPHSYRWRPRGLGAGMDVTLVERGGVIVKLETEIDVHSASLGDRVIDALITKYGDATRHDRTYTWRRGDRHIEATRRGTGQVAIIVEER